MILRALRDLRLDSRRCFVIGDKASDLQAGARAGCRTIWLTGDGLGSASAIRPTCMARDWSEVLHHLTTVASVELEERAHEPG